MTVERHIEGKTIRLRDIEIEDAAFVVGLRTDESKSRFLNKTSADVDAQIAYIQSYKSAKKDYYFIIEKKDGTRVGTVRIYDIRDDSFCWGSWLMVDGAPTTAAIESALLIYEFAFYILGFERSHFDVRHGNIRVADFHKRMGAKVVSQDDLDLFFNYEKSDYEAIKPKYARFLK